MRTTAAAVRARAQDRTQEFRAMLSDAADHLAPLLQDQPQPTVVVFVRGYLAQMYRAIGRGYFDAHAAYCKQVGLRVLIGDVSGCRTSARNSASLFAQVRSQTSQRDRVLLVAHSHGTLAALDLLCNPAYSSLQSRMGGFIAINGVFGGTPVADVWTRNPCLRGLDWCLSAGIRLTGGEHGIMHDMTTAARRDYYQRHREEIAAMVQRIPMLCVVTAYERPAGIWDLPGFAMLLYNKGMQRYGLLNDGCVPCASQKLPGADYIWLDNLHHAQTVDDLGGIDLQRMTGSLLALTLKSVKSCVERAAQDIRCRL